MTALPSFPAGIKTFWWAASWSLFVSGLAVMFAAALPLRLGNLDWEVGAIGEAAATGPLVLIGFGVSLFVGTRQRRRWVVFGLATAAVTTGLGFLSAVALLALDVPLVQRAAEMLPPDQARVLRTGMVKAGVLAVVEAMALLSLGVAGFRWWAQLPRTSIAKGHT